MRIQRKFKSSDPFAHLRYPRGATGLKLNVIGYWFATDYQGYFYLVRDVIESMDYEDPKTGEQMCGVTPIFSDTYWRVRTKAELRILLMRIKAGKAKKHYDNEFELVHL